ncbi:MAG: (4Fe-4S)-binding protein [Planctomycetes bacterium GWF2_41_51]|nr:MAG: (4Fe-4S)-binding protein [Planctomycetes bacterium GWF2_41_51]HBG28208.1 (4Fe-4S)-binding protein [Phycisphaerales bacterium]
MKELVIISGKGGTGKTSIAAAFASLAQNSVIADCDVDAADLHLVLSPTIRKRSDFSGGKKAFIHTDKCIGCGVCLSHCRFGAVVQDDNADETASGLKDCENCEHCKRSCSVRDRTLIREMQQSMGLAGSTIFRIDSFACQGCKVCVEFCPVNAIDFRLVVNGEWFISDTRFGPMVHAKLGIAEENSGKLVTLIRKEAKKIAEEQNKDLIIIDGSPGIGCPVIASITGADLVLVVTEPTLSGKHDLERVAKLTSNFKIKTLVCINKADINPEMSGIIEQQAAELGLKVIGKIPYDEAFTKAQLMKAALIEYTDCEIAEKIKTIWQKILYEFA